MVTGGDKCYGKNEESNVLENDGWGPGSLSERAVRGPKEKGGAEETDTDLGWE